MVRFNEVPRIMKKYEIDTPQAIVDVDKLDSNIKYMNDIVTKMGANLRPHIKNHKTPAIAHRQLKEGASGITVAKLSEAEVMSDCGIKDIFVAYPIVGINKMNRLLNLMWDNEIKILVDSIEVAIELSKFMIDHKKSIGVLVEIETGLKRSGVLPQDIIGFVKQLKKLSGINFLGVLTYGGLARSAKNIDEVKQIGISEGKLIASVAEKIEKIGIPCPIRSAGSTPTAPFVATVPGVTEVRCGNYVFNDATGISNGVASIKKCSLTVICTVVSCPADDRVIIDGGSKTFTTDMPNVYKKGYGFFPKEPDLVLEKISEEHGIVRLPKGYRKIKIGEKLEIIPNHACVIPNLMEYLYIFKGNDVIAKWPVLCRGKSQ